MAVRFLRDQPPAVYLMSSTEFWERFSYYGFLGILVLFLTDGRSNGGLALDAAISLQIVGLFTGLVWFAPIVGGWLADRYIGARKAVMLGCAGLAFGNGLLAFGAGMTDLVASLICLTCGMAFLIMGAGLFKSNASALLSQLYVDEDPRRDAGFALFYMGINLGAAAAPLVVGTVGQTVGWRYGFALSSVGMIIGLIIFLAFARTQFPENPTARAARATLRDVARLSSSRFICEMAIFASIFCAGLMQYGGLLNLYADRHVDRTVFGMDIPAAWFLTLNPIFIILLGSFVARWWVRFASDAPQRVFASKIMAGLILQAVAFAILSAAALIWRSSETPAMVLVVFYLLLTLGELCVIPAGLAEISRTAPREATGLMMGLWLLTMGAGSVLAGQIGWFAETASPAAAFALTSISACVAALALARVRRRFSRPL